MRNGRGIAPVVEFVVREGFIGAHRVNRFKRPAPREDRQTLEQPLFAILEQIVAPINEGSDRRLPRQRATIRRREYLEGVVELRTQIFGREGSRLGGGEFDRKRDTVEPASDLRDMLEFVGIAAESIVARGRAESVSRLGTEILVRTSFSEESHCGLQFDAAEFT
jgi:hypothetical protein